jgi:hypothetical protein
MVSRLGLKQYYTPRVVPAQAPDSEEALLEVGGAQAPAGA